MANMSVLCFWLIVTVTNHLWLASAIKKEQLFHITEKFRKIWAQGHFGQRFNFHFFEVFFALPSQFQLFYLLIYFKIERESHTESSHLLIHSTNASNSQNWARNSIHIFHMGDRRSFVGIITAAYQSLHQHSVGIRSWALNRGHSDIG